MAGAALWTIVTYKALRNSYTEKRKYISLNIRFGNNNSSNNAVTGDSKQLGLFKLDGLNGNEYLVSRNFETRITTYVLGARAVTTNDVVWNL